MAFQLPVRPAPGASQDLGSMWAAAISEYRLLTEQDPILPDQLKSVDEFLGEFGQLQTKFEKFRHNESKHDKLRSLVARSLGPILLVGDIVSQAAKSTFPPSEAIFAAIRYLVSSANAVSADYSKIESFFNELQAELNSLKILEGHISNIPELQTALMQVLTSVLVLCGMCTKYIRKGRLSKTMRALVSGEDSDLKAAQEKFRECVRREQTVVKNATLANVMNLKSDSRNMHTDITRGLLITEKIDSNVISVAHDTGRVLEHLERQENASERENILRWLSPDHFHDKQRNVFEKCHQSTCVWLLNSDTFQKWWSGDANSILWCPGIPGAGKTVMLSKAVTYVEEHSQPSKYGIAHVYCDYKEPKSALEILRSAIRQLAEQFRPLPAVVKTFYDVHSEKRMHPSVNDFIALVKNISQLRESVFIFIDALDECSEEERESLLAITQELESSLRLFVTSRINVDLSEVYQNMQRIDIVAEPSDIEIHLQDRITKHRRLKGFASQAPNLKTEIIRTIQHKAAGMFLLAHLQMSYLETQTTVRKVREALKKLPEGLFAFYDQALRRVKEQEESDRDLADRALSFIFCARRTLRLDELLHALSIEPGDSEFSDENCTSVQILLGVCAGLIRVGESDGEVSLVHLTLQEYFQGHSEVFARDPESKIAEVCLTYLSFDTFEAGFCEDPGSMDQRLSAYIFLDYAARQWGTHARQSTSEGINELVMSFLHNEHKLVSSVQVLYMSEVRVNGWHDRFPRSFCALHAAAYWGLGENICAIFAEDGNMDQQDSHGATPLHYAAQSGHVPVIRFLVARGSNIDQINRKGQTALVLAAKHGHTDAVEALLAAQAELLTEDKEGWTALHWAIICGHNKVVKVLLDRADVSLSQQQASKALILASEAGNSEAVKILLEKGADVNGKDPEGSTPLDWAVPLGRENVVHMLLKNGANLTLRDNYENSSLHWAISHPQICKLLLENGADVNGTNIDHRSALHWSAQEGQIDAVQILLDHRADINMEDVHKSTALHAAAFTGNQPMVQLLLDRGADANKKDKHSWTPLHVAAVKRHAGIQSLLLDRVVEGQYILDQVAARLADDQDRNLLEDMAESKSGGSQVVSGLRSAANSGQTERVMTLLDNGADINAIDAVGGSTALTIATWLGKDDIVRLLVEKGANVDVRERSGQTALHMAARDGYPDLVELLVSNGAQIDLKIHGWTAMLLAMSHEREWIANFLIHHGANVNCTDYHGRSALHWASKFGWREVTRLLLGKGAQVDVADRWGRTPLLWAAYSKKYSVAEMLLDDGADTRLGMRGGYTPLHVAADNGDEKMINLLLGRGAPVDFQSQNGLTAYDIADVMGFRKVVKRLAAEGAARRQTPKFAITIISKDNEDEKWHTDFSRDNIARSLTQRLGQLSLDEKLS